MTRRKCFSNSKNAQKITFLPDISENRMAGDDFDLPAAVWFQSGSGGDALVCISRVNGIEDFTVRFADQQRLMPRGMSGSRDGNGTAVTGKIKFAQLFTWALNHEQIKNLAKLPSLQAAGSKNAKLCSHNLLSC